MAPGRSSNSEIDTTRCSESVQFESPIARWLRKEGQTRKNEQLVGFWACIHLQTHVSLLPIRLRSRNHSIDNATSNLSVAVQYLELGDVMPLYQVVRCHLNIPQYRDTKN